MSDPIIQFCVLLVLLQIKHVIADYGLQSRYILENRRHYGHPGGLLHVAIHAGGSAICLLLVGTPPMLLLTLLAVEAVLHYHIDWMKDRLTLRLGLTASDQGYWFLAGTDQGLHQLTYVGMALAWTLR